MPFLTSGFAIFIFQHDRKARGTVIIVEDKEKSTEDLHLRFEGLAERVRKIRLEWMDAHAHKDVDRETRLVQEETAIFTEINELIEEFAKLVRGSEAVS